MYMTTFSYLHGVVHEKKLTRMLSSSKLIHFWCSCTSALVTCRKGSHVVSVSLLCLWLAHEASVAHSG